MTIQFTLWITSLETLVSSINEYHELGIFTNLVKFKTNNNLNTFNNEYIFLDYYLILYSCVRMFVQYSLIRQKTVCISQF